MSDQYDEEYFLRGRASGRSLYDNYRWMPEMTGPMVAAIVAHCGIREEHRVLDFGCARGYVVRALREQGYDAWGYDTSTWAVENCDPAVREYVSCGLWDADWIIAKDVLEHIEYVDRTVRDLMERARVGVFVVVPLSLFRGTAYVVEDYERDVTHVQRLSLIDWAGMFVQPRWRVEVSYRVPGVKDNWYRPGWERGNGFLTARRVES